MPFPAAYPIKPLHPSPVTSVRNGKFTATRRALIQAQHVDLFIDDLMNWSGPSILGLPTSYPNYGRTIVTAIDVSPTEGCAFNKVSEIITNPQTQLEGYDPDTELVVTYSYDTIDPAAGGQNGVRSGTYVTFERNASFEVKELPTRNLRWQTLPTSGTLDRVKHDSKDGFMITVADISCRWHYVDESTICAFENFNNTMQGRVNSNTFAFPLGVGTCSPYYPPETLMYMGYSTSLDLSVNADSIIGPGSGVDRKRTMVLHWKYRAAHGFSAVTGGPVIAGFNHSLYDGAYPLGGGCGIVWNRIVDECGNKKYETIPFGGFFL